MKLINLLAGTICEEIANINEKDYFNMETEVSDAEKIVGELTDFEKKLYTLWMQKEKKHEAFKDEKEFSEEHEKNHLETELLQKMFWSLIRLRLPASIDGMGVRSGDKIVELTPKDKVIIHVFTL